MPDMQTQAAQLLTGGLDVMRISNARQPAKCPSTIKRFEVADLDRRQ